MQVTGDMGDRDGAWDSHLEAWAAVWSPGVLGMPGATIPSSSRAGRSIRSSRAVTCLVRKQKVSHKWISNFPSTCLAETDFLLL